MAWLQSSWLRLSSSIYHLAKRLWSIVVGAVLYRLVLVIILAMNVDAQMLKLASAILLAIILYVPEVRQKLKIRPNKSLTPGGDK